MIPLTDIQTLFLDAGNTLVSVDFAWIADEIRTRGHDCSADALERAEAAARPHLDAWLSGGSSTEGGSTFTTYLRMVLERVPDFDEGAIPELAEALLPVLVKPGSSDELWRRVMPSVPQALGRFRELGLDLIVVSNSDGSVDRGLGAAGLRHHFSHVVDSAVVGFEKPDPRIFETALACCGGDPARTLHVGDLVYADVAGARAAGLHAALLDPYDDWADPGCPTFADLSALAEAFENAQGER